MFDPPFQLQVLHVRTGWVDSNDGDIQLNHLCPSRGKGKSYGLDHPQWKMIYRSKFGDTVDGRNLANQLTWKYLVCWLGFQLCPTCTAIIHICSIYIYMSLSEFLPSPAFYVAPSHPRMVDE